MEFPDELQCVDLKLLPNDVCAKAHPEKVTDVMLCAGQLKGGKDTCSVSGSLPPPQGLRVLGEGTRILGWGSDYPGACL